MSDGHDKDCCVLKKYKCSCGYSERSGFIEELVPKSKVLEMVEIDKKEVSKIAWFHDGKKKFYMNNFLDDLSQSKGVIRLKEGE